MATVFNVDEFLKEKSIVIQLGNKEFEVKDIPADLQSRVASIRKKKNEDDSVGEIQELICGILGCSKEDLKPYGIVAYNAILEKIYSVFFPESSPNKA